MGALPWRAAAPGGVARPQSRRRAIVRRSEGKLGLKGVVRCSYLCAMRRRLAEGRSGGAEMDSRQHGGAPSSAVVDEVDAGVVVGCSGPGETPEVEAEPVRFLGQFLVRRSGDSAAAQSGCAAEQLRGGALGLGGAGGMVWSP